MGEEECLSYLARRFIVTPIALEGFYGHGGYARSRFTRDVSFSALPEEVKGLLLRAPKRTDVSDAEPK